MVFEDVRFVCHTTGRDSHEEYADKASSRKWKLQ